MSDSLLSWEGVDLNEIIVDYADIDSTWTEDIDAIFNSDENSSEDEQLKTMVLDDNNT